MKFIILKTKSPDVCLFPNFSNYYFGKIINLIKTFNYKIVSRVFHVYENKAYTICFILAESHFVISSYPEIETLVFDICLCKEEDDEKIKNLINEISKIFGKITYKKIINIKEEKNEQ